MDIYTDANQRPTAVIESITPNPAEEAEVVTFVGQETDPDGSIVYRIWYSTKDGYLSGQASFSTSALSVGTHTISFAVKDDCDAWSQVDTASLEITEQQLIGDLIAYWDFDDGTATDRTGNGHNGTAWGAELQTGVSEGALYFDGDDDYVQFNPDPVVNQAPFTVCAWVKPTSVTTGQAQYVLTNELVGGYGFTFVLTAWGEWRFQVSKPDGDRYSTNTAPASAGEWTFLCGVWDGNYADFYVNESLVLGGGTQSGDPRAAAFLVMGRQSYGTPFEEYPFQGLIDEVQLYNTELDSGTIQTLYQDPGHNFAPTATIHSIDPVPSALGENVAFVGYGEDPYGYIADYYWWSSIDGVLSTAASFNTSSLSEGTHTIHFAVQDNQGESASAATEEVTVIDGVVYRPRDYASGALYEPKPLSSSFTYQYPDSGATTRAVPSVNPDTGEVAVYVESNWFGYSEAAARLAVLYSPAEATGIRVVAELDHMDANDEFLGGGTALLLQVIAYEGAEASPETMRFNMMDCVYASPDIYWYTAVFCIRALVQIIVPDSYLKELWEIVGDLETFTDFVAYWNALEAADPATHRVQAEFEIGQGIHLIKVPMHATAWGYLGTGKRVSVGGLRYISIEEIDYPDEGNIQVIALCPVDIVVTDPGGNAVSKTSSEIGGATYIEGDLDFDGDVDDQVRIEDALDGVYEIKVEPEAGADPNDTFTLIAFIEGVRVVVAEDVPIADVPDLPYELWVDVNQRPVAMCQDVGVEADSNCQGVVVPADVDAGSYDPDGDPISLSLDPPGPYPLGTTSVTLTATDDRGRSGTCTATVTVEDTTPPAVTCSVTTDVLWASDHHLVEVGLTTNVSDECDPDGAAESLIIEVWSDETEVPETGDGSGRHAPDAKDICDGLRLRNERRGSEDGRVYLIIARAEDASGNVGFGYCTVMVPHDQSEEGLDEVAAQAEAALATVEATSGETIAEKVSALASQGWTQHGVSEELGPHQ